MEIKRQRKRRKKNMLPGYSPLYKALVNTGNRMIAKQSLHSDTREDASPELIEKAKESGVVQKVNGEWRIVAIKKKKLWNAHYDSKKNAEAALRGYQANKH